MFQQNPAFHERVMACVPDNAKQGPTSFHYALYELFFMKLCYEKNESLKMGTKRERFYDELFTDIV